MNTAEKSQASEIGLAEAAQMIAALDTPGRGLKNAARSAETPAVIDAVQWARSRAQVEDMPNAD